MKQGGKTLVKPVKLSREEYAAIDKVPPYQPGHGIPLADAVKRAKKRTKAWMNISRLLPCMLRANA